MGVRVDKCPNCGAILPPAAGDAPRVCSYCGVEVARATRGFRVPGRGAPSGAPSGGAGAGATWIVVGVVVVGGIIAVVASRAGARRGTAAVAQATAGRTRAAPPPAPVDTGLPAIPDFARVDPIGYGAAVLARGAALGGYQLTSFTLSGVRPSGVVDLTLAPNATATWRLRSPQRSVPPAGTPRGVAVDVPCAITHTIGPAQALAPLTPAATPLSSCTDVLVRPPTCTPAQIWTRAIARGAPADAVATLRYDAVRGSRADEANTSVPGPGGWRFSIEGTRVSLGFPDTCATQLAPIAARTLASPTPPDALPGDLTLEDDAAVPQDAALVERLFAPVARRTRGCLASAARGHDAIYGAELRWRFDVDGAGRVRAHDGRLEVLIEGIFVGKLGEVRDQMRACVTPALAALRLPASSAPQPAPIVVAVRLGLDGKVAPGELTRGAVRAALPTVAETIPVTPP